MYDNMHHDEITNTSFLTYEKNDFEHNNKKGTNPKEGICTLTPFNLKRIILFLKYFLHEIHFWCLNTN